MEKAIDPRALITLSSTQTGSVAEVLVAAQLMLASNGRLSPFRPCADDDGTDLLVGDKQTGRFFSLQIKASKKPRTEPTGTAQFDTRVKTFKAVPDNFVLAVAVDPTEGQIWRAWLFPAQEFESVAYVKKGKLIIEPSLSPKSVDRYTPWRCETIGQVIERLIASLSGAQ